jgi:hypothetical protein
MTRFLESPIPYLLIGLAVVSILLILYLQTRRAAFMAAILLVALLVVVGIFVEQAVVTDREAIETAVYDLAASVEANDMPSVLRHISPQATKVKADAEREMNRYKFALARIVKAPGIEIIRETSPPTARVRCQGVVRLTDGQGSGIELILTFGQEGELWLLNGYTYEVD